MSSKTRLQILVETLYNATGLGRAKKDVDSLDGSVKKGGANVASFATRLETLAASAAIVGTTLKTAFDIGREGAQLDQLGISFERVEKKAGGLPDLLGRIEKSTEGTIDKATIQKSALTLVAGASDEYTAALLAATPRLAEIATASTTLNPLLGTTSKAFDDLGLGVKRQSPLIVDNLGLTVKMTDAVKEVHPELQSLTTEYEELTREQRFLNEVLHKGDVLISQTGDSIASAVDPYDRLATSVTNLWDSFKMGVDERVMGSAVEAVNGIFFGGYGDRMRGLIETNTDFSGSLEELVGTAQRLNDVPWYALVFGGGEELSDSLRELRTSMAGASSSFEEYWQALQDAGLVDEYSAMSEQAKNYHQDLYDQVNALEVASQAMDGWGGSMGDAATQAAKLELEEAASKREQRLKAQSAAYEAQRLEAIRAGSALASYNERVEETAAANAAAAIHQGRVNDAFRDSEGLFDDLAEAQTGLVDATGEWVEATIDNAGRIEQINEELASDLTADQKSAYTEILKTVDEGTTEWLAAYDALQSDLSESQRNGLIAQISDLESANGEIVSVYTGNAAEAEEMSERVIEATAAITESYKTMAFEQYLASEGVTEATLAYGVQLGILTKEQATARLEYSRTSADIIDLTSSEQFLTIATIDQYEATQFLIDGLATNAEQATELALAYDDVTNTLDLSKISSDSLYESLQELSDSDTDIIIDTSSVDQAGSHLDGLKQKALDVSGTYDLHFNISSSGSVPSLPSSQNGQAAAAFALGGYTGNRGGVVHPHELVVPRSVLDQGSGAVAQYATQTAPNVSHTTNNKPFSFNYYGSNPNEAMHLARQTQQLAEVIR